MNPYESGRSGGGVSQGARIQPNAPTRLEAPAWMERSSLRLNARVKKAASVLALELKEQPSPPLSTKLSNLGRSLRRSDSMRGPGRATGDQGAHGLQGRHQPALLQGPVHAPRLVGDVTGPAYHLLHDHSVILSS